MLPDSPIRSWSQLDPEFRARIEPVLRSDRENAEDRWKDEFVGNPSSAAGFALIYAAMQSAGVWDSVGSVINTWAVGMFFVPTAGTSESLDRNPSFTAHNAGGFRHRLAHHSYWERSWIQTNIRQAGIHIGINREPENGHPKAEVHLDVFNGFHNGFDPALSARHILFEVMLKRIHSSDLFESLLRKQGIVIPSYIQE
jgi:hypothetical protein